MAKLLPWGSQPTMEAWLGSESISIRTSGKDLARLFLLEVVLPDSTVEQSLLVRSALSSVVAKEDEASSPSGPLAMFMEL
eukprot:CAMPEP_0183711320 /NCGR_PEP_ID=MMETSP0737-20130205/6850_1 /TAXON_ID=385413 /ORGANISM="Thalassiosira miniscula, Strain CCMP1093" /LENGTH=79 /DNA_ID=CAMNT_0025939797 /DNA_START=68 /DNA_END=307 /DNA_ORIENTATION=+